MAGAGKKTFTAGEVLTASDVNTYLMEQSVMNFAGTAARSSAIPTPSEGMVSYRQDVDNLEIYNGTAWLPASAALQVLSATTTSAFTTSSTSFVDITGLSVTITPRSVNSKILVLSQLGTTMNPTGELRLQLVRASTAINIGTYTAVVNTYTGTTDVRNIPIMFLDSPATTSATTYKVQMSVGNGATTGMINRPGNAVSPTWPSSITVIEVGV
jgi:hypothetical protein